MTGTHTHINSIGFMHSAVFALEFGIAEGDDVAGPDFVELLDAGVGEVGVDEGTVGAAADGFEGVGEGGKKIEDEGVGTAVADHMVFLGRCSIRDLGAILLPCGFQLVLTEAWWGRLVALFERGFLRVLAVVADGDDGLAVVDEEHVNVFCDCRSTATSLCYVFLDFEQDVAAVLESWGRSVGLCPPESALGQVDVCGDVAVLRRSSNIHTATHIH